jgi:hypothetical protein
MTDAHDLSDGPQLAVTETLEKTAGKHKANIEDRGAAGRVFHQEEVRNMPTRTKSRSTQVPAKIGRPTKYSLEWADQFCELLAQGQSVRQICSQPDQPHKSQVYRWLEENDDFRNQYARAREEQADHYFQEIIDIADNATPETVNVARLRAIKQIEGQAAHASIQNNSGVAKDLPCGRW